MIRTRTLGLAATSAVQLYVDDIQDSTRETPALQIATKALLMSLPMLGLVQDVSNQASGGPETEGSNEGFGDLVRPHQITTLSQSKPHGCQDVRGSLSDRICGNVPRTMFRSSQATLLRSKNTLEPESLLISFHTMMNSGNAILLAAILALTTRMIR
jgi:hypothetical protein